MRKLNYATRASAFVMAIAAITTAASAQEADDASATPDDEIVVTAVAKGQNVLDSSIIVSSLSQEAIANASPRSVAELFRSIPGIRSESSGGEGNANIAVRGLPVASGGAKFLQLQEDGLPVLEFGDITFGNADIFLRSDFNVSRVESVRGGSASTFASNSPGGVINLISKTGEQEGGAIQTSFGLDYGEYRLDFDYGGKISDDLLFHVGGFYRQGEGPRNLGYDGLKGGQLKFNITKKFDSGFIRFYGKYLDDRAVGYLPNPVRVTGTNAKPKFENLANFSITGDSLHSRYFTTTTTLDGNNNISRADITDGMRPLVKSFGFEANFDVADGWNVTNKFRFSDTSGTFVSPFPGSVTNATGILANLSGSGDNPDLRGVGGSLVYSNGPGAGSLVPASALVARIVVFNTRLKSLDNITNDFRVTKDFNAGGGEASFTLGFYKSRQDIKTEWNWTSHFLEVAGGGNARLIDARSSTGTALTQNGTYGYGAAFFGGCCRRVYDLNYDTNAPFASLNFETGNVTLDGSIRWDLGNASGQVFGSDLGGGRVGTTPRDINGDGTISAAEQLTSVVPLTSPAPVDYNYDYISYSLGANYKVSDDLALFARYSKGGRANADRILFNNDNVSITTGALQSSEVAVDFVTQLEGGIKYRSNGLSLFGTLFYARTQEQNFEATTQRTFDRAYKAIGLELEGSYRVGGFSLTAGATYTDAEISRDSRNAAVVGKTPRRQAKFVYQFTPQYQTDLFTVGASVIGTSKSFAQDDNGLVLPGFAQVNAFFSIRPMDRVQLSLNANNLFDTTGITESEEGGIPGNGIVRARSINGRTVSAAVKFEF